MGEDLKQDVKEKRSMSARERNFSNLSVSAGNQFPRGSSPALLSTPRRTEITSRKGETPEVETRRRCERNYSDILFNASTSASARYPPDATKERKEISRGEPTGSSSCSFLDPHAEIINRRRPQSSDRATSTTGDASRGPVQIWN